MRRVDGGFARQTFVSLSDRREVVAGRVYLATTALADGGATLFIAEDDATVVRAATKRPAGVALGQKWVLVSITAGTLVAYQDLEPSYATLISPGAGGVPIPGRDPVKDSTTPTGTYYVTFKDRAATMSPEKGKGRIQFVQEIQDGKLTLGYLRITLEEQKLLAAQDTHLKVNQEKQRLMLLVMLLAGLLISYGVRRNYMRVRKHKKQSKPAAPQ